MTRRARVKYLVDLLLLVTVGISITTGVVKIPELTRYFGRTGLVLPYNTISLLHDTAGVVLVVLVLIHLALGWRWLAAMTGTIIRQVKGGG
jgi:hypothetical protein